MPSIPISPLSLSHVQTGSGAGDLPLRGATQSPGVGADKAAGKAETYTKFEALIHKQFVEAMLPKDADNVYGSGFSGDAWKSMLAEKIATEIAERGSLGIARELFANDAGPGKTEAVATPQLSVSLQPDAAYPDLTYLIEKRS